MGMHNQQHVCISCGHIGQPKDIISGSFVGEFALWVIAALVASITSWMLLIGPLGYSIYRISSKKHGCALCGSPQTIPVDSPNGKALIDKIDAIK